MTQHCTRSGLQMAVINILLALVSAQCGQGQAPVFPRCCRDQNMSLVTRTTHQSQSGPGLQVTSNHPEMWSRYGRIMIDLTANTTK